MRKKQWSVLLIALLLTLALALPVSAGQEGNAAVGVQIQNKTTGSIDINTLSYPQDGSAAEAVGSTISVPAESAFNYYIPNYDLKPGKSALVVSSTGSAGGIARTDWSGQNGAAIYSTTEANTSVLVSLVLSKYAGQTSEITVQNTNTAADINDVKLTLYARGSSTPQKEVEDQSIAKGTSKSWNIGDTNVWGSLPNTGEGTTGFVGSMLIESATPLVVQSFIDIAGTSGVTGFTGVSSSSADSKVYCPLIRANYYGDTGMSIVNNNGSAATVDITFRADPASPEQGTFTQQVNVAANSSSVVFQGPTGDSRNAPTNLPAGSGQNGGSTALTNNGFYGTAELSSTQPILVVVNDTEFGSGFSVLGQSTYNCAPASAAAQKHYLPLLRNGHVPNQKLTTGVQVFNVSDSASSAELKLTNGWNGAAAPSPAAKSMAAKGAANFYGGDWTGLATDPGTGTGWFGAGIITCDQDCIVIVSDESTGPVKLDRANYNGIVQ